MIALQARAPQVVDPSRQNAQFANMMNMVRQSEAAQRQASLAQQSMDINQAQEDRAAALQVPAMARAQSEATGADLKTKLEFQAFVYTALKNADNAPQVVGFAERIAAAPQFQDPLFQGALADAVASMPTDPAQFDAWRRNTAAKTLTGAQQLEQDYIKQTTGTEERLISVPKFGGGGATEVAGSRIQVAPGMTYVRGADGAVYPMPSKSGGGFDTPAPAGAPGKGGVAAALQTNPGALKDGAFARSQPGYTGASGGFATFDSPAAGAKAQENLLSSAYLNKGFNTINKIINKYAPQGPENSAASVSNYKKYVAQKAGVDINAPVSAAQIPAIAKAMREFETGQTGGARSAAPGGLVPVLPGSSKTASTEDERKISSNVRLAASAARDMAKVLREDPAAIAPSGTEYAAGQVPFYGKEAAKFAQSGPRQRFDAALAKFVLAATYITTGAGVAAPQIEDLRTAFFPTYQDTDRSRQNKLLGALQFVRDAKDRAGSLWTPELESELNTLEKLFQNPASYKPKAKAATPTKSSDGWGSAKQVGN
jgi:hypothetical protein